MLCTVCVLLLQLVNNTHPSQVTRLYEMPEFFSSVTHNSVREQLQPGRKLQQEIDVRVLLAISRSSIFLFFIGVLFRLLSGWLFRLDRLSKFHVETRESALQGTTSIPAPGIGLEHLGLYLKSIGPCGGITAE